MLIKILLDTKIQTSLELRIYPIYISIIWMLFSVLESDTGALSLYPP